MVDNKISSSMNLEQLRPRSVLVFFNFENNGNQGLDIGNRECRVIGGRREFSLLLLLPESLDVEEGILTEQRN